MANPKSRGIGTGAAQVFTQNETYNALKDAANMHLKVADYKNRREEQRRKEEEEKRKQNLQLNAAGLKTLNYDASKLREADISLINKQYKGLLGKYEGRFEEIQNGGQLANEFRRDLNDFKSTIALSSSTKGKEKELYQEMFVNNPDKYTQEQRDNFGGMLTSEGVTFDNDYAGKFNQKLNFVDWLGEAGKQFQGMEGFMAPQKTYITDEGTYKNLSEKWMNDSEGLEKWEAWAKANPEVMTSMNNTFPDSDNPIKEAYESYKAANINENINITQTTNEDKSDDDSGGFDFGYNSDLYNISYNEDSKGQQILFGSAKDKKLAPMMLSIQTDKGVKNKLIIPDTLVYKKKDGKGVWTLSGLNAGKSYGDATNAEKVSFLESDPELSNKAKNIDGWDGMSNSEKVGNFKAHYPGEVSDAVITESGEPEVTTLTSHQLAQLKNKFGIKGKMIDFLNKVKGGGSSNEGAMQQFNKK